MNADPVTDALTLLDWRRRVSELYREIRADPDPEAAWSTWRRARSDLFRRHPQSPIPASERADFSGPYVYPYDGGWRVLADVEPAATKRLEVPTSTGEGMVLRRWALARFSVHET